MNFEPRNNKLGILYGKDEGGIYALVKINEKTYKRRVSKSGNTWQYGLIPTFCTENWINQEITFSPSPRNPIEAQQILTRYHHGNYPKN